MRNFVFTALLLAGLNAGSGTAFGFEATCYVNDGYSVAAQANADSAGTRFAVTRKKQADDVLPCVFDENAADYVIGDQQTAYWHEALTGKFLVLRESTGPQGFVAIFDLAKNVKILDVGGEPDGYTNTTVSYWERAEDGTAQTCEKFAEYQSQSLGAVILRHKTMDFSNRKITDDGYTRCDAVQ